MVVLVSFVAQKKFYLMFFQGAASDRRCAGPFGGKPEAVTVAPTC